MPKTYSGKQVIKMLCRYFGFSFVSQKGSHAKLAKVHGRRRITTIVLLHKTLAIGTLKGILELAEVSEKDFRNI